jgi:hypothetical protein
MVTFENCLSVAKKRINFEEHCSDFKNKQKKFCEKILFSLLISQFKIQVLK